MSSIMFACNQTIGKEFWFPRIGLMTDLHADKEMDISNKTYWHRLYKIPNHFLATCFTVNLFLQ